MRRRGYIVIGEKPDGSFVGYTENSFSMTSDCTDRVRVWIPTKWTSDVNEYVKGCQKYATNLNKKYPTIKWAVYRIGTEKCPVKIDWGCYHNNPKQKYTSRNLRFTKK